MSTPFIAVGPFIDAKKLAGLDDEALGWWHKGMPRGADGMTARGFVDSRQRLADLHTPLLTLDAGAIKENLDHLASWCADHRVLLAPHGKTTMAPQLWADQLDRGAWGITLANFAQLRIARAFGVRRLQLANSLTDPRAIEWVAAETGPECMIISWVDSVDTVRLIEEALEASATGGVVDVLVELGGEGGRTGARGEPSALEVARAVATSDHLRLVGVSGYEGALAHTASVDSLAKVGAYLAEMKAVHLKLLEEGLYEEGADIILTAGGSAYFDNVVNVLGECINLPAEGGRRVELMIRSGAYIIHDDGFYSQISPFSRDGSEPFRAGMFGWARVVSQPEAGLAILDAGKRDLPFDEGLPRPQAISSRLGGPMSPLTEAAITAINDQHCFMSFDPDADDVSVGDVVRLGLSHPCTAMDKWTLIPVLDETEGDQNIVGLVRTFF
ncbi:amino acid deaminase [Aeromicrobium sp.]|uniref:amino acid deaminase n=1 Tax=Aeromicrobium sp. TaxID=1871063 RepID=UPI0019B92C5C|nr:amino acid deaminase [Aeromicrobium sp.]MBC7630340.1 amino acid deaminase [Aeromicrobium sp.]